MEGSFDLDLITPAFMGIFQLIAWTDYNFLEVFSLLCTLQSALYKGDKQSLNQLLVS